MKFPIAGMIAKLESSVDLVSFEAVGLVRDLARRQHSQVLAQLASRMAAAMRAGGEDPFSMVKSLIAGMIAKLEQEAGEDVTMNAYSDKELQETYAKKLEKCD